jgi:hypothetical protein
MMPLVDLVLTPAERTGARDVRELAEANLLVIRLANVFADTPRGNAAIAAVLKDARRKIRRLAKATGTNHAE